MIHPAKGERLTDLGRLEWNELWGAMKAHPDKWILSTINMYREMLGTIQPKATCSNGFLMGEPVRDKDGEHAWYCFILYFNKVYCRELTYKEFRSMDDEYAARSV